MKNFYYCCFSLALTLWMGTPDWNDHGAWESMQQMMRMLLMRAMAPVGQGTGIEIRRGGAEL